MTASQWSARCVDCNEILSEDFRQPELACPHCGSTRREFSIGMVETGRALDKEWEMEGQRGGDTSRSKGKLFETFTHHEPQRSRGGALARHERTIDKARDRYTETVTTLDTGEVIKHCDEPLHQHTGHGSDRPTKPRSRT